MIAVQIFDQRDDVHAEGDDDRVNLSVISLISLAAREKTNQRLLNALQDTESDEGVRENQLTWRELDRKSIIFCTARVPCMLREIWTKSCATDWHILLRCSSVENSRSF